MEMFAALSAGFAFSLSLIAAIGAQNAFVLRQGIAGQHVFWVCAICALSDAVLIQAGVFGMAALQSAMPALAGWMRYGGAVFLLLYGLLRLHSAWRGSAGLQAGAGRESRLAAVLAMTFAITWLNPHVYLDTVLLLGTVAARYHPHQAAFAVGAAVASAVFFFSLGYGARRLRHVLSRPAVWRGIEAAIAVFMFYLAGKLLTAQ